MTKTKQRVASVMYHSIGIPTEKWHWNYLTCPYEVFEDQLKWLKKTGYKTLNFQEVYDFVINEKAIPKNAVFLTFDDGYLDNYVFAYPLLKKYGFKGTIFVNPDFVDRSAGYRKTLEDVNDKEEIAELAITGFCNWDELKKMDEEGVLDVQSHAKTHTWYPVSDKIIDFRHPGDDYVWMNWNDDAENKPNLQCIDWERVQFGTPVFEHEKALSCKRVFINSNYIQKITNYVKENGGVVFFEKDNWREDLFELSEELKKSIAVIEREESYEDYVKRMTFELQFTKEELEQRLNKKVEFICWPGGSATKKGVEIADKLGYLMSTAARDIPELRKKIKNSPSYKINRIARFVPIVYNNWKKPSDINKIKYSQGWFFIFQIMRFDNRYFAAFWMKYVIFLMYKLRIHV
ncbi:MAG: polysaccharide deacetylase family protein [Flavobacteriaceae bacterium]